MMNSRKFVVGIMGAGDRASEQDLQLAEDLGRRIAERGWAVLTGGREAGVMNAALRGAKSVPGSLTIGILPGSSGPVSPFADVAVFTGMGDARNAINVLSSDAVVVCGAGGAGTASEAALALKSGKPLILLQAGPEAEAFFTKLKGSVRIAANPEQVIALITAIQRIGG